MEVCLIRHAESEFNTKESQDLDSRLTLKGLTQAYHTAKFLKTYFKDCRAVIASPFQRTWQTAQIISFWNDYYMIEDWRLREHIYALTGYVADQFPLTIDTGSKQYVLEEVDTDESILERLKDFWNSLDKNGKYVIISHGTPVHALIEIAKGNHVLPKWDKSVGNCSITHVIDGKVELDKYTGHLKIS